MRTVVLVFRFMHIMGSAFSECFRVFALIHDLLRIEICSPTDESQVLCDVLLSSPVASYPRREYGSQSSKRLKANVGIRAATPSRSPNSTL